ncbi:MAG: hypothetical protein ACYDCO_09760 [Armatimonadota bacterium]
MISIGVLLIALVLLIGLGLLISLGIRSLAKHSPVVAFSVLGAIFLLLLVLVLSIPTLRYQSACRNLGSTEFARCESAFAYLISTKGVQQAFDLALTRGSVEMRASLPHFVEETYKGKWTMLHFRERQRINADQALKILVRCLGDKDVTVASSAASYLSSSSLITPQNMQASIPYLNRDLDTNALWWVVNRPELVHAVPDHELAKGLARAEAYGALQVFQTKYCEGNSPPRLRPGAPRAMLLDMLASPNKEVQAFACYRLHDIFTQAIPAGQSGPLLGNRAFEKKLGLPADRLRGELQRFLHTPGKKDDIAQELAEEMLYYLTEKKGSA